MAVIKSGNSTDQMTVDPVSKAAHVTLYDTAGNVLSVGGGTQYTEDAAAAADPVGNIHIMVRKDTPSATVSADGDNIAQRGTNFGAAYVTLLDTSGGAVAVSGGTQYTEDVAAAADPIGTALNLIRADTLAGITSADGDNVAARGTDKGEQYVKHVDPIPVTDNAGSLTVDNGGTFAVQAAQSGTWTVQPGNTANTTAWKVDGSAVTQPISAAALPLPTGASTSAKQPALGTAGTASPDVITIQGIAGMTKLLVTPDSVALPANQSVNVAQINGVTPLMGAGNTGTGSPRVTIATDQAAVATTPAGNVAHDAVDSGNPIKIGAKAETSPKGITLVADGDRTDLYADADGILIIKTGTAFGDLQSERISNTDGASTAFSTFGATANLRNFVTQITVHNAHATTSGYVDIRDGTAGAILWTIPLPATGGATIHFNPPLRQPTANTALAYDVSAAITTIYISVNGFQSKA